MSCLRISLAVGIILSSIAINAAPRLVLDTRGERLTLLAEGMPLIDVLERIAAATGIVINLKNDGEEEPVSVSLEDATVEEVLRQVLQGHSSLFRYDTGPHALAEVYVLQTSGRRAGAMAKPVETIRVVGESIEPGSSLGIQRVSELDAELSSNTSPFHSAEELLVETDSGRQLTALQHLAARPESADDALAAALVGHDLVLQSAAQNMLLNSGLDEQAVKDVMAAVRQGDDEAKVRAILDTLHPP
ncbi:MAG: hypothetical protein PHO08_14050 [Methylococcales bacterium]|nr:hypothetical protein [Methylococcales bacterium]MDD5631830.1 hypothetical protein [Methylococcales bacterium]